MCIIANEQHQFTATDQYAVVSDDYVLVKAGLKPSDESKVPCLQPSACCYTDSLPLFPLPCSVMLPAVVAEGAVPITCHASIHAEQHSISYHIPHFGDGCQISCLQLLACWRPRPCRLLLYQSAAVLIQKTTISTKISATQPRLRASLCKDGVGHQLTNW